MYRKEETIENIKKTIVLVVLISTGMFIVWLFEGISSESESTSFPRAQTIGSELLSQQSFYEFDGVRVVQTEVSDDQPIYLPIDNIGGEVLGMSCDPNGSPPGCSARAVAYQPLCVQGSVNVNFGGGSTTDLGEGIRVTKNAAIEAWRITSPMAIFSGIESMPDNTYKISDQSPAFRPASELIDTTYVAKAYMAPGRQVEQVDNIVVANSTQNFAVHVQASIGGGSEGGFGPAEARVEKTLGSVCEWIQPSDPDVKIPNALADVTKNVLYSSPARPIEERHFIDYDPVCVYINPNDIDLVKSEIFVSCMDKKPTWQGIVQGIWWGLEKRAQCLFDPAQCEQVEIFGLIIDSPFGKNSQCEEGSCSDQYFDYSVASSLAPGSVNEYRDAAYHEEYEPALSPHYVTTPCQIRVDYGTPINVPCLWDVSPYWNSYLLEMQKNRPNDPDFMTFNEYWAKVEELSEARGAVCNL